MPGKSCPLIQQNPLVNILQDFSQNSLDLGAKYSSVQWPATKTASTCGLYWLLPCIRLLSLTSRTWIVSFLAKDFLFCLYSPLCTALCMTEPTAFKRCISISMITQAYENNYRPGQNEFFYFLRIVILTHFLNIYKVSWHLLSFCFKFCSRAWHH